MKNLIKIVLVIILTSTSLFAQSGASTTTTARAQILIPLTITNNGTMLNFGSIIKPIGVAGTAKIVTNGNRIFEGVSGSNVGLAPSNPIYVVTGTANTSVKVTLPTTIPVTNTATPNDIMNIDKLLIKFNNGEETLMTGANISTTLLSNGTSSFILGGTLNILANTFGGIYQGTFDVSVDYD